MFPTDSGRSSRMRPHKLGATIALGLLTAMPAHAGFFIPKDITKVMVTATPDEQNYEVAYGLRRDLSIATSYNRFEEAAHHGTRWRELITAQAAYLLHRQGDDRGIFNAYLWGGPIAERVRDQAGTRYGAQGGLWVDYETRSLYTRIKLHSFKSSRWQRNEVIAQAMLAPYEADYEDIASWGGLQLKRASGSRTEVTPFVRFFQRNWWVDAGISVDRPHRNNFFLNLMVTF